MISLPKLPYAYDQLEPFLSEETVKVHYEKHHRGYVEKVNELIEGTDFENADLDQIVLESSGDLFNNAAQVWNHNFYWQCLKEPEPSLNVPKSLLHAVNASFGSFSDLKGAFEHAVTTCFASNWVWLVKGPGESIKLLTTHDAETPIHLGLIPILTCDVWEHAYYIDFHNEKNKYTRSFWRLIDWEFVNQQFAKATSFDHAIPS